MCIVPQFFIISVAMLIGIVILVVKGHCFFPKSVIAPWSSCLQGNEAYINHCVAEAANAAVPQLPLWLHTPDAGVIAKSYASALANLTN